MLLQLFSLVTESRRNQSKQFELRYVLLFTLLAIMSGCVSYRNIASFIKIHFKKLKKTFRLKWKKPPAYCTLRYIIINTNPKSLESAFRKYSDSIQEKKYNHISLDGKSVRWSFDNVNDKNMLQVFSAFLTWQDIILAHEDIDWSKTNEIPVAQCLIKSLGVKWFVFTADAMHCQKKL